MDLTQRLGSIFNALNALDLRKKLALAAGIAITIIAAIFVSVSLNKPATLPIYTNLSQEDVNSMSRILAENNIGFSVGENGGEIGVDAGLVARARMLLAEHGLPTSQESGYQLFDRMNTIGLTSFMQDVTNKRAIEGELARTIQMISGVNSARVHLVMPEKNIYQRARTGAPTASVVLKTYGKLPERSIHAVRHLVSAAVPNLDTDKVTIVGADGMLLTAPDGGSLAGTSRLVELEREFESEAQMKIAQALGAHLGAENFRVSVTAKLNGDRKRVDETVFDPESKVERSTQIVRENGTTQNQDSSQATTIEQNMPDGPQTLGNGQSSSEKNERREETTQYEINEKKVSVVSDGYQIEALSIALVVNKARILALLGENSSEEAINAKLEELRAIVRSAISLSDDRGDQLQVSIVEFIPADGSAALAEPFSIMRLVNMHTGAFINAAGLIIAAILFALLGIRPLLAMLSKNNSRSSESAGAETSPISIDDLGPGLGDGSEFGLGGNDGAETAMGAGLGNDAGLTPLGFDQANLEMVAMQEAQIKEKLEALANEGEERVATAMRQWLKDEAPSEESLAPQV